MRNFSQAALAAAVYGVLLASAPALASEESTGPAPGSEIPYQFEADSGESVEAFRGAFKVPENRADPNSRMITLHYVRFPATNPQPAAPIVYLAGGPGGSGVRTARWRRFAMFMALRDVADVIAFEQRGTGWSNDAPDCETEIAYPLDAPIRRARVTKLYQEAVVQCAKFWAEAGVDIRGYNTLESARDLDALRVLLGADKISLWSISYGTHLAMAAVRMMDERIERIVMAGAEGLHQTVKLPARTDAYFDRVQAAIDKDPAAKEIYPDVKALMRRVQQKLADEPAAVEVDGPGGARVAFVYGKEDMQLLTAFSIADPRGTAGILAAFLALDNGAYDAPAAQIYRFLRSGTIELSAMSTAMDIASGISEDRLAQVNAEAEDALVGSYLNFPMPHLRGALPGLDLGDGFRAPAASTTPTLLLTGTLDGRTYPESQIEALAGFSDVRQIMVENAGHNLFMSDSEIGDRIGAFLKGEDVSVAPIALPLPDFRPRQ